MSKIFENGGDIIHGMCAIYLSYSALVFILFHLGWKSRHIHLAHAICFGYAIQNRHTFGMVCDVVLHFKYGFLLYFVHVINNNILRKHLRVHWSHAQPFKVCDAIGTRRCHPKSTRQKSTKLSKISGSNHESRSSSSWTSCSNFWVRKMGTYDFDVNSLPEISIEFNESCFLFLQSFRHDNWCS